MHDDEGEERIGADHRVRRRAADQIHLISPAATVGAGRNKSEKTAATKSPELARVRVRTSGTRERE
jgi:hypothetical protein